MRTIGLAFLLMLIGAGPAAAWWSYAEWGMSPMQLASASGGRSVPCRPDAAVCSRPAGGLQPTYFVDSVILIGMPASVSFAFSEADRLVQTVLLFPKADMDLIANLLQGIRGAPAQSLPGGGSERVWHDERRGTIITAAPVDGGGVIVLYRPMAAR